MSEEIRIDPTEVSPAACVANNLRMITRTIVQAYEDALRPSGLTISQFSTLGTLNQTGPVPIMKLAEVMELDRTTLARNLRLLERDGLVQIEKGVADRRIRVVNLTAKGGAALERAVPFWTEVQQRFVSGLGTSNLNYLMDTFDQIRELAQAD
jgi:DNA-binding MarR family transcriptional regulator